jgi:hypothetical protein
MPSELLQELELVGSQEADVDRALELMSSATRIIVEVTREVARDMAGSARTFEGIWRHVVLEVAKGQTVEMQAARPRLRDAFEKRIRQLKFVHDAATELTERGETDVPNPDHLLPEIAGMERLKAAVFDRWQTADDLEALAVRDYPLSTADLERIGQHRQPPQEWYEEHCAGERAAAHPESAHASQE